MVRRFRSAALACTAAAALAWAGSAAGQTVTASVRGAVHAAASGSAVSARDVADGQVITAPIDAAGRYVLSGLRPGDYDITVRDAAGAAHTQRVSVAIGQSLDLDLDAAPPPEAAAVVVRGRRLVETKTSEVATNVSQAQIRNLPQTDRNFLSFAALAPGVRYNDGTFNRGFSAGASDPSNVNVFIDGLSLKNDVLPGGIAGQQGSRGNPFPQLAVDQFRVLTQNYKAEYEQASSAVITAATKSGGNEVHGEAFFQYTDKSLTEQDVFSKAIGAPKPDYERKQYGASLGGPIVQDKLFFFAAYEGNEQTRSEQVRLNSTDPALLQQFGQYLGFFPSPFREDLGFAKLTWTPDNRQTFDLSANIRRESDVRDFGRNTAYTGATQLENGVDTYLLRHTFRGDGFLNEAAVQYLNYQYEPQRFTESPTYNYLGFIQVGGATQAQSISQQAYTFRDDLTLNNVEWHGSHIFKFGVKYAHQHFNVSNDLYSQPYYEYREPDLGIPYLAYLGIGNPDVKADDNQIGLYAQDDWAVNHHLTLNIGLRWDYEDNLFNNDFVTPPAIAEALHTLPQEPYFRSADDFITSGAQRPADASLFQPRVGFSYDVFADQKTVLFGGYGRYYDRNVFTNTLDEKYRLQYNVGTFYFSRDGSTNVEGQPTVVFQPQYLTQAGLETLRDQAQTGLAQVYVVKNDDKVPQTDQFTVGLRQKIGIFYTSIAGTYIKGEHGLTYIFLNRDPTTGDCCAPTAPTASGPGFSYITGEVDQLRTRYKGLYVTVEKPYTDAARWGLSIAYTLAKAEQNGDPSIYGSGGLVSYNCLTPDSCGFNPRASDVLHTIVVSGQLLLPFGLRFSTLTTLSSPAPYLYENYTNGYSYSTQQIDFDRYRQRANCLGVFSRCTVDLKFQKEFTLRTRHHVNFYMDIFNVFNNKNYGQYDGYIGFGGDPSPTYRQPLDLATQPRSFQFGAAYRF